MELSEQDFDALVESLSREILDKVVREVAMMTMSPATVMDITYDSRQGRWATVHIDGDEASETRQMSIATSVELRPRDRVLVVFDPPHGGYVWGIIDGADIRCGVAHFPFHDTGELGWDGYDRLPLIPYDGTEFVSAHSLSCGFDLVDGDDDGFPDSIVIPYDGTYGASAAVHVFDNGTPYTDGTVFDLEVWGGIPVPLMDQQVILAAASNSVFLHTAFQVFYARKGDEIYAKNSAAPSGPGGSFGTNNNSAPMGLSVIPLCCGFTPEFPPQPS